MSRTVASACSLFVLVAAIGTASAQPSVQSLSRPASIAVAGGFAASPDESGRSLGASAVYEVTPRIAIEGRGVFLEQGRGSDALELTAGMQVALATGKRARPYAAVGGGFYRARLNLDTTPQGTMLGYDADSMMGQHYGSQYGPQYGTHMQMPFYTNRMGDQMTMQNGQMGMRSFTDPAVTLGGGVTYDVATRFYVRPDVRALVVFGGGDTMTQTTIAVGFGYRF